MSELDIPGSIQQWARWLAEESESTSVATGVRPSEFAAACIYKARHEEGQWLTQSKAAEATNVTPPIIRSHQDALAELAL